MATLGSFFSSSHSTTAVVRRRRVLSSNPNAQIFISRKHTTTTIHASPSLNLFTPANNFITNGGTGGRAILRAIDPSGSDFYAKINDCEDGGSSGWNLVVRLCEALSMAFPLWIGLACFVGLWKPTTFVWANKKWQITGLTLTMLGMGMTLTLDDLKEALLMPKELIIGFILQYTVMPLSGFLVSKFMKLPSHYAAGLILVSCCPGGTASNIVTFLSRGNVALSVLMTAASTISAVVMTPLLTSKLAGQYVAVDPTGLFTSTVQVVLAPVLVGALLNQYCNFLVRLVSPVMPLVAVASVAILCGSAISQNSTAILSSGFQVVLASCWLHGLGFSFGYIISRLLGVDVSSSRTISVEVGMQNSVLGLVLACKHFGNPLTSVPCAVSSVCHSIYGSVLAGFWRSLPRPASELKG